MMENGYRKFEPSSEYFKFQRIRDSIAGRLLAPVVRESLKGEPRNRHRIELVNKKVKILPDNSYLNGALDEVLETFGAGKAWVQVVWTAEKPSKKGHPLKIYDVLAKPYSIETAADGPDLFEQSMPA